MTGKATTVLLAAMFASQVALTAASFAGGPTVSGVKAELTPAPDVSGEGEAKYTKKTSSKGTEEKFKGEVEFPMDLADLADLEVAVGAMYDMYLFHSDGTLYAVCSLVIKEIEFKYQSGNPLVPAGMAAEYVVEVSQKTPLAGSPTLTQKVGGCWLPDFVTPVFPVPVAGDTAEVLGVEVDPLLTGMFH